MLQTILVWLISYIIGSDPVWHVVGMADEAD